MSTPSTPNIGPQATPARRGGSVTGGPWQLIEVNNSKEATAAKPASQQGTPLFTAQRSPPTQPADAPALEELNIDSLPPVVAQEEPSVAEPEPGSNGNYERWGDEAEAEEADGFNAQMFIGDWTDNLGHRVLVSPTEMGGRQRDRRKDRRGKGGGKGRTQMGFLAIMQKFGMPEKRFNINKDRTKNEWTCGNGALVREETSMEKVVWKADDGRGSTWTRTPPEGPVFFDAPPAAAAMHEEMPHQGWGAFGMQSHPGGAVYFNTPETWSGPPMGEWKGLNLQADGEDPSSLQASGDGAGADAGTQDGTSAAEWNLAAPEFVPGGLASVSGKATTPLQAPAPAPSTPAQMPAVSPVGAQALACELKLSEESADVTLSSNRLEWVLPDDWGKLSRFPKDFCLTSPMFGVKQATNMQLVFYPNGSRTAEAGRCTVALTRGPDSAGIKFEFSVNGRGSGPKVCLGRRYLGDYPKPFDDEEESKTQQVVVCMQVLEVLGI